ncbi:hypothetical protein Mapa_011015 [Marchantia paleacea]|nr:hypothetical protein Mapa_011015 [Marchantia paleacea]
MRATKIVCHAQISWTSDWWLHTVFHITNNVVLLRYSAVTVMGLIREIARCESSKLDFNALVKKSTTGISCAREYQALWRHIAYRAELDDTYEEDAELLEDDSDLEFELEPAPSVSPEVAAEAATWVKADMQRFGIVAPKRKGDLLSKLKSRDADSASTVGNQAPASSGLSASATDLSAKGAPVAASAPAWDAGTTSPTGTTNQISSVTPESPSAATTRMALGQSERKKRKLWTQEEDQELIAAVEKCGEGNWTNILKGAFTHDRTAAQLSQRWALIRKRREVQAAAAQKAIPGSSSGGAVDAQQGANQLATTASGAKVSQNGGTIVVSSASQLASPVTPGAVFTPLTPPVVVTGTTPGPSTSAQPQIQGLHVSGSSSNSPGSIGVTSAPNGTLAPSSGSLDGVAYKTAPQVARPSGASTARTGAVVTQRQGQAVGAARSTAGSSTASAVLTTEQIRGGVAKTGVSGIGAGRLIAPGAVVMSAAAAQAASVGGSEMWQASSLPPAATQSSVPAKYGSRGNAGPSSGRVNMLMKQQITGPDPGVQAAAVAAGARIAPASAAASLLKAAQSGNVVHIGPGGVPITKTGLQNQAGIGHGTNVGSRGSSGGAIVHYIRTGAGAPPPSLPAMMRPTQQQKSQPGKSPGVNQINNSAASKQQSSPAPSSATSQAVTPPSQSK